jgi:N-acetylglucosaminyl-diphospho-decaprenol L-rhamnosyltransferase
VTPLHLGVVLFQNPASEVEQLLHSLGTLERIPDVPLHTRFLDNSPSDALRSTVTAALGADAYRWTRENRGFGATHNLGMREAFDAGAEAYLCVNPDAVLHPACLRELWGTSLRPRTGLVDARTFPEEHPKPYDPSTGETPWCAGTVLLVRREAFLATSGFDEQLFLYGEDVDLSWRTRAAGLVARTAPGALVFHWVEHRPLGRARELEVLRSATYLGRKWGATGFARRHQRLYQHLAGTPLAPLPTAELPPGARGVADFRHGLRFARSRW